MKYLIGVIILTNRGIWSKISNKIGKFMNDYQIKWGREEMAMSQRYVQVCQWCGARGGYANTSNGKPPAAAPRVPGKCKGHPSGQPNMPHNPRWELG